MNRKGKIIEKQENTTFYVFATAYAFHVPIYLKELNVFSLHYDNLDTQTLSRSIFWKQFLFHLSKLFASIVDTLHLESFRHLVFLL